MSHFIRNLAGAALSLSLAAAPLAFAQQGPGYGGQDNHNMQPDNRSSASESHGGPQKPSGDQPNRQYAQPDNHGGPQYQTSEGNNWRHGDHYTGQRRVVSDWKSRHLRQPPHGYEWVQDGNQYVLIALTGGLIASVIINAENH